MIKRRSFLGLLAAIPVALRLTPAQAERASVASANPTSSEFYAGRNRPPPDFGIDGDMWVDYTSPNYVVWHKARGEWWAIGGMVGQATVEGDSVDIKQVGYYA